MPFILIEHEQHPDVANVIGLYELEKELNVIVDKTAINENKSFHLITDYINSLDTITAHMCNEDGVQIVKGKGMTWEAVSRNFIDELMKIFDKYNISINIDNKADGEAVEGVVDEMIRPALAAHAGNMEVVYIEDGVIGLRLLGSCQGCPFSLQTLTFHVAKILGMYFPDLLIIHIKNHSDIAFDTDKIVGSAGGGCCSR